MGKAKKAKKNRARTKPFTAAVILGLTAALGWQLHSLHQRVADAQEELEELTVQVQEQQAANDALSQDIAGGLSQEKMEEIARRELGYVNEREYVFIDVSN